MINESIHPINIFESRPDPNDPNVALVEGLREGAYQAGARGETVEFLTHQALKRLGRYDLLPHYERE